jgi:Uma2 family endonuclease
VVDARIVLMPAVSLRRSSLGHARRVTAEEGRAMHMASSTKYWTAEDLKELPDDGNRYEVIDGELLVTPAPSLDHQEAIARLHLLLAGYVASEGFGHVVFEPADVEFSSRRLVQPDLFVLPLDAGRRPRAFKRRPRLHRRDGGHARRRDGAS